MLLADADMGVVHDTTCEAHIAGVIIHLDVPQTRSGIARWVFVCED